MGLGKKRKNGFTIDEVQTATLAITEGYADCVVTEYKGKEYRYPALRISSCVKEALEPASRVFGTSIRPDKRKRITCPPELFPPDGRGIWTVSKSGKEMKTTLKKLSPLIPEYYLKKWEQTWKRRKCPLEESS
ncbi:MAG: hypothetical protein H3Z53_06445 [archaeon]|nr:hypothetical protein [archaeon]